MLAVEKYSLASLLGLSTASVGSLCSTTPGQVSTPTHALVLMTGLPHPPKASSKV